MKCKNDELFKKTPTIQGHTNEFSRAQEEQFELSLNKLENVLLKPQSDTFDFLSLPCELFGCNSLSVEQTIACLNSISFLGITACLQNLFLYISNPFTFLLCYI